MTRESRVVRPLVVRFSLRNRARKARRIVAFMQAVGAHDVVLVGCGVLPDASAPYNHVVENAVAAHATVLLAVDVRDCPGVPWPFERADGRDLPLPDGAADLVLANAVVEHVGDRADQERFVRELGRVGRAWVVTTPNRWFPVEAHTSTLFRHWSSGWSSRQDEFTRLLSRSELAALLPPGARVVGRPWSPTFTAYWPGAARTESVSRGRARAVRAAPAAPP